MKIIFSLVTLIALLWTTAIYAQDVGAPVAKPAAQDVGNFVFLYGRANYFRALVRQRRCDLLNEHLFTSVNQRFENVRSQLAMKYGENIFPPDKSADGANPDRACDLRTLESFDTKVKEIEQLLGQYDKR